MSGDESLEYLPDGFREGGRTSNRSADAAEDAQRYLRGVDAGAASFGGADGYVSALNGNGARHARNAGRAAEDRNTMSEADHYVADLGEETNHGAEAALRSAHAAGGTRDGALSRGITEGM